MSKNHLDEARAGEVLAFRTEGQRSAVKRGPVALPDLGAAAEEVREELRRTLGDPLPLSSVVRLGRHTPEARDRIMASRAAAAARGQALPNLNTR